MILFHGSDITVENPKIITPERGRDFGFGFYTTDLEEQAVRWAKRKAMLSKTGVATLNIYEYDEVGAMETLLIKEYAQPSMDWMEMIIACRSDITYSHQYDIVIGKIADDNVGETISFVMEGIMRKEDALDRLKFQKINSQICFNTEKALKHLTYKGNKTY